MATQLFWHKRKPSATASLLDLREPQLIRFSLIGLVPPFQPLLTLATLIGVRTGRSRFALAACVHAGLKDIAGGFAWVGYEGFLGIG